MGTIQTAAQKLAWDVNSNIKNMVQGFKDKCSAVVGRVKASAAGILNGDVVGINTDEVENMNKAIEEYVVALQKHLDEVKTEADNSNAFKGEYAEAVKDFVDAICESCGAVISYLREFENKLEDVREKYIAKDEEVASDIKSQAGDLRSQYQEYTR